MSSQVLGRENETRAVEALVLLAKMPQDLEGTQLTWESKQHFETILPWPAPKLGFWRPIQPMHGVTLPESLQSLTFGNNFKSVRRLWGSDAPLM